MMSEEKTLRNIKSITTTAMGLLPRLVNFLLTGSQDLFSAYKRAKFMLHTPSLSLDTRILSNFLLTPFV